MACITISSTSKPSSRKKPRSLATKKGMEVVLLAANPMRTRVRLPPLSAEKAFSVLHSIRPINITKRAGKRLVLIISSILMSQLKLNRQNLKNPSIYAALSQFLFSCQQTIENRCVRLESAIGSAVRNIAYKIDQARGDAG